MKAFVPGDIARSLKLWFCVMMLGAVLPIASWAAPACLAPSGGIGGTGAPIEHGGIGGTGAPADHGGIGGTGAKESPARGGIGGTGQQAEGGIGGTGIVGIITGFGSVCVNGLEVQYAGATPVSMNGLAARSADLAIGQIVAIDASGTGRNLVANNISILNALEGPVTQPYTDIDTLYVMGQRVRITADTHLAGIASLGEAKPGLPVRVSGYRNAADEVVASRIDAVGAMAEVSIIGIVTSDGAGPLAVSRLPVLMSAPREAGGTEALVRGTWDGQRLNATSIRRDPSLPFAGHVGRVIIEGLVLKRIETRQLTVNGFDVTLSAATAVNGGDISEAQEGQRIRVTGRLGSGRNVTADHVELMNLTSMQPLGDMGKPMGNMGRVTGNMGRPTGNMGRPTGNMGRPTGNMDHADQAGREAAMPMGTPGVINLREGMSPATIPMGSGGGMGSMPGGMSPSDHPIGGGGMGGMHRMR